MTSTQSEIEVAYDISNDFFKLWLDTNMHYTSAVYTSDDQSLEDAQENKARVLYDMAEITPEKRVCDIGCGWGS
ncbi:MAG: class I SAM-dependent methyltransferase, partial [Myxococcales bacterium]|nr:class I SAM-dependent methyltransferase [Myxococcales bacterium]